MASRDQRPKTEGQKSIDWTQVERILVVKLRSIGDTVLSTPALIALRRFLPNAQIDILLEDWVAPLLDGFDAVDNVISVEKGPVERLKLALNLRRRKYDTAFNLHGGTTATFFAAASLARHRIGYADYQYPFLYNHLLSSSADFWQRKKTHSAEQQLALLGFVGVPVEDQPESRLAVTPSALKSLAEKFAAEQHKQGEKWDETTSTSGSLPYVNPNPATSRGSHHINGLLDDIQYALLHPASAFFTKQWPTENFARTAEFLAAKGIRTIAVASKKESDVLHNLKRISGVAITTFDDLTLPEITALASQAKIFVGNDSGIAHIAAAVNTPSVVIFGSSNRHHWHPWTHAPNEIVYEKFQCQPCQGYECKEFGEPRCILSVRPEAVFDAIEKLLFEAEKSGKIA